MSEHKRGLYRPVKHKQQPILSNITRTATESVSRERHNIVVLYKSNADGSEADTPVNDSDEEEENIRDDEENSRPLSYYNEKNHSEKKADTSAEYMPPEIPDPQKPADERLSGSALAAAAITAAIAVIIGYIGTALPILSLLFPVPIAIITMRQGWRTGAICSGIVALLLVIMQQPLNALLNGWQIIIIGMFFGSCFRYAAKPLLTILGGTVLSALSTVAAFAVSVRVSGMTLVHISGDLGIIVNDIVSIWAEMGFTMPEQYATGLTATLTALLPAMVIIASLLTTIAVYWILVKVARQVGYRIRSLPKFREWQMPWQGVWGIIIGAALYFIGGGSDEILYSVLYSTGLNILCLYCPLLFMMGLALCLWILRNYRFSPFFKVMIVIIFLLWFDVAAIMFILLGLFDPFIDIRGRFRKKAAAKKSS